MILFAIAVTIALVISIGVGVYHYWQDGVLLGLLGFILSGVFFLLAFIAIGFVVHVWQMALA